MQDWEQHVRNWIEAWCGQTVWKIDGEEAETINRALDVVGGLVSDPMESLGLHPSEADYTLPDFVNFWCGMQYISPKSYLDIEPDDVVIGSKASRKAVVFFTMRGEIKRGPKGAKLGATFAAPGTAELRFADDGKVDRIRQWFDQRVLEAQTGVSDVELRDLGCQHGRPELRPS